MNRHFIFVAALLILQFTNIQAQEFSLTKSEMLQDFDQAIAHINTFAVHKDLNEIRLQINYEKEYKALRKEITGKTSLCEFRTTLKRATNFIQDFHGSFLGSGYLNKYGKYQKKINFNDDQTYEKVKLFEDKCGKPPVNLKLPILYNNGKYYVYADFSFKGITIKRGTEVTSYNGKSITDYIKKNYDLVWTVKLDETTKMPYHTSFYRFGDERFKLGFNSSTSPSIQFALKDSVTRKTKKQRDISYFSQSKPQVLYFDESKILYIGLPMMDTGQAHSIVKKIDAIKAKSSQFSKIIVDIRGNPGGSDVAWRTILRHLIHKEIPFLSNLKFKFNKPAVNYYREEQKNVVPETINLLNNKKYWKKDFDAVTIAPSKNSLGYKGKIYVLQDEFVYSSASNFSNFCLNSDQLVSVGTPTDFVGGVQTEPLFIKLDHSELIFTVEPLLDFSGVKTIKDFSHNKVEVNIRPSAEDYFIRTTYKGDIYSAEFLSKHDRLFKWAAAK